VEGRELYDIGIPELSRQIVRRPDLHPVIDGLNLAALRLVPPLEPAASALRETMPFEAYDVLTGDLQEKREYVRPQEEVVAYYAEAIARRLKASGHFAPIAAKVMEFFRLHAFGGPVELSAPGYLEAMASRRAGVEVPERFISALRPHLTQEQPVTVQVPSRSLYTTPAFKWSRPVYPARRSVFNLEACDNEFERDFAS
jgi:hypothetical protein